MTSKRVSDAAWRRGILFDGEKRWLNNTVGYGYEVYINGRGFVQSDNLNGIYRIIMNYPRLED